MKWRTICLQYDKDGNCLTRPSSILMGADSVQFIERAAYDEAIAQAKKLRILLDDFICNGKCSKADVLATAHSFDSWLSEVEGDE